MRRRIAIALASSAIAEAVQLVSWLEDGALVTASFAWSHWLIVLAFYLVIALTLGGRADERAWTAAALLLPITFSIHRGVSARHGSAGVLLLILTVAALIALWSRSKWLGRGRPLVAGAAGALAGTVVARFASVDGGKGEVVGASYAWPLLVAAAATTLVILAGRRARTPSIGARGAVGLFAGVGAVAIALLPLARGLRAPHHEVGQGKSPPVVLIVLDTLRADHLRLYGYGRDTMPSLERFAREHGRVAERMVANGASSLPSHGSLFTGLYPPRHGAHKPRLDDPTPPAYGYPLLPSVPTLASLLRDRGYWTAAVNANFGTVSEFFGFARGFDHFRAVRPPRAEISPWLAAASHPRLQLLHGLAERLTPFRQAEIFSNPPYVRAARIVELALEVVDAAESAPFFLFVNFLDPHTPYRAPDGFDELFSGSRPSRRREFLSGEEWAALLRGDRQLTAGEIEHLRAAYDQELAYLDSELRRLLDHLRRHPRWQEMLVVLTSDHGEALGERSHLGHSISLYDEIVRIPLIVKTGRSMPDLELGETVQSVDVFAGILEYAGLPLPAAGDGLPWGRGRSHAFAWAYVHQAFARLGITRLTRELVAVERDRWKLIRSSTGEIELFDLRRDPGETRNLASVETERRAELLSALESLQDAEVREERVIETSPQELQKLRALGYVN